MEERRIGAEVSASVLDRRAREIAESLPLEPKSMAVVVIDCLHAFGYRVVKTALPDAGDRSHDPAIVRAAVALMDLRNAMTDVRQTLPNYMPGHEPTAADNCRQILEMMDWNVRQIAAYLGVGLDRGY